MKKFIIASIVSLTVAPAAFAQATVDLAAIRAACAVGGGACRAAVLAAVNTPVFTALTVAEKSALVGTIAAEVRSVGLQSTVAAVDLDVVAALDELSDVAAEEGDTTLAESIQTAAVQVESGETEETAEPIAFSTN